METRKSESASGMKKTLASLLVIAACLFLGYALSLVFSAEFDLNNIFKPAAATFLAGHSIYGAGFYNPPFVAAWFVPFLGPWSTWFWCAVTVAALIVSIRLFGAPTWLAALSIASFPVGAHLLSGQIDVFLLLAVALGYTAVRQRNAWLLSVTLMLMTGKPINVFLVAILFCVNLPSVEILVFPALALGIATAFAGVGWVSDYVAGFNALPPVLWVNVSTWRVFDWRAAALASGIALAGFVGAWIRKLDLFFLTAAALTANMIATPYLLVAHEVLLIPAFIYIGKRAPVLAVVCWLSAWVMPILNGPTWGWIYLFEISIFLAACALHQETTGRVKLCRA